MTMLLLSVEIQLTLEDSGSPRATSLGYSINDETCEVAVHCFLYFIYNDYEMPKTFPGAFILSPLRGSCPRQEGHSQGPL